jgi:hypothetical protein
MFSESLPAILHLHHSSIDGTENSTVKNYAWVDSLFAFALFPPLVD